MRKYAGDLPTDELYSDSNMEQVIRGRAVIVSNIVVLRYHVARVCNHAMAIGNYHFGADDFFPHVFAMMYRKDFPAGVRDQMNRR